MRTKESFRFVSLGMEEMQSLRRLRYDFPLRSDLDGPLLHCLTSVSTIVIL
jgi:hypothetical protein